MFVSLLPPECHGETVHFRWLQSAPSPFLHESAFWIRYEGLDTAAFSDQLWMEIWFALVSRVFGQHPEPVTIVLPEPMPHQSVDYWLARRGFAGRIHVTPTTSNIPVSPWRGQPAPTSVGREIGLLFGGGKDSLAALSIALEAYDPDKLLLVHYLAPFVRGREGARQNERRTEQYMLKPALRLTGVEVQRIATNYRSNLVRAHRELVRPHLELLVTASLPVALTRGITTLAHADGSWTMSSITQSITQQADGGYQGPALNMRPESLRLERRHYRAVYGHDLLITNPVRGMTAASNTIWLLRHRPDFARQITTCIQTQIEGQFCYGCDKCSFVGLIMLAEGIVADWFDFDALLSNDRFWTDLLGEDPDSAPLNQWGNVAFSPGWASPGQYPQLCDALHRLDPAIAAPRLSLAAATRLSQLKRLCGNAAFPQFRTLLAQMVAFNDDAITADFHRVIASRYPVVDQIGHDIPRGNDLANYDFDVRLEPYTAGLPHLEG